MKFTTAARFSAAVASLALLATGCASAAPEATDAVDVNSTPAAEQAASDGKLVLYSGRKEDLVGPLIEQFEKDSGITVDVRYGNTGEMSALLLEEGAQTPAQVFLSQDAGALGALTSAGLAWTLPDDIADSVPAGFTSTDGSWVGITGRARVIVYDTEAVAESEVPDSVADLTDPSWSGRVAFAPGNASFQSALTAMRVLEGEDEADAWVKGISENSPQLTESNGDTLELVNTGVAALGLINHYYWYEAAAEVGADNMRAALQYLPGDSGGIVNVTGAAILDSAANDPDAIAFVEYLLSDEGQTYFVEETFEYPLVEGVEGPEGVPALATLVNPELDLSDLESLEKTQELLAAYGLI